jgi:hypothetical protein
MRELKIAAGTMLTGKIHKYPHFSILLQGDISVLVGDEIKRLTAPAIVPSPAGIKRIALAHTDTVWLTIHPTDETDPDLIEAQVTAATEQEFAAFEQAAENQKCLS